MFNLNPFRKSITSKLNLNTDVINLKQVYRGFEIATSFNIVGFMYVLSKTEHELEPSMLSSYELLMSPLYSDVKSKILGSKISVLKGNKRIPDLILNHRKYKDEVVTYDFNILFKSSDDDDNNSLTGILWQLSYENGQFYRVKSVQKNEPVLMYELFENQDSKTIPSNYIRQVVKNKIMNYDLFNPSSTLIPIETNSISVYSLLEVLVFNSVHILESPATNELIFKNCTKDFKAYRTHLEHLLHINYIYNTLNLPDDIRDNLLTAQGYSIFNSILDSTELNQTKQEYNQLYSMVHETNIGIDRITTKLYNSLISQEQISSEVSNQIITALNHESNKVCVTMSDLDRITESSLPINKAKELTTSQSDEQWKSFLQFLND